MSKYTAPPNPQGNRPRSMRSLAINYRILPGSYTVRFSCLLPRSGDPWRGPSNWGLGTKDTQAHILLALWYSGSLWMSPPSIALGGEAWRIWQWSIQEIAHRGWSRYGTTKHTAIDRQGLARARTLALDKLEEGSSGSQGVRTSKEAVYSRRPTGPLLCTNNGKPVFFILLRC